MPNFKKHISSGFIGFPVYYLIFSIIQKIIFGYYYSFNATNIAVALMLFVMGSDFPDVDHDHSLINKVFRIILIVMSVYYLFDYHMFFRKYIKVEYPIQNLILITAGIIIGVILGYLFNKATKHRGIWHTVFMAAIFSLLIFIINYKYHIIYQLFLSTSFFSGYCLHLILDKFFQERNGKLQKRK